MYQKFLSHYNYKEDVLVKVEPIFTKYSVEGVRDAYDKMLPNTYFFAEDGGLPEGSTYWISIIRTKDALYCFHSEQIVKYSESKLVINADPEDSDWRELFIAIGPNCLELSHYDYMELVIEDFWKSVFNKTLSETWNAGIIGAHGDKAYGYKSRWKKEGIPFGRGVLIFLLTYTKELGERQKCESCEWVIENYPKYLPMILEAEKNAGL